MQITAKRKECNKWHLKNYPTRRKLLKDVKELREENKNLKNELKKARIDKSQAEENSTNAQYALRGYKNENTKLCEKLSMYESAKAETYVFECVGVENANDYKVV